MYPHGQKGKQAGMRALNYGWQACPFTHPSSLKNINLHTWWSKHHFTLYKSSTSSIHGIVQQKLTSQCMQLFTKPLRKTWSNRTEKFQSQIAFSYQIYLWLYWQRKRKKIRNGNKNKGFKQKNDDDDKTFEKCINDKVIEYQEFIQQVVLGSKIQRWSSLHEILLERPLPY